MLDWILSDARLAIAGALGGAVNWMTRKAPWRDGVTQILVGSICAVYVTPAVNPTIQSYVGGLVATPEQLERLSSFAIGVGGVTVSGLIIDLWTRRRAMLRGTDNGK